MRKELMALLHINLNSFGGSLTAASGTLEARYELNM